MGPDDLTDAQYRDRIDRQIALERALEFAKSREVSITDTLAAAYQFYKFLTVEDLDEVE